MLGLETQFFLGYLGFIVCISVLTSYLGLRLDSGLTNLKRWGVLSILQMGAWAVLYFNSRLPQPLTHVVAPSLLLLTLWGFLRILQKHFSCRFYTIFFAAVFASALASLVVFTYIAPNILLRRIAISLAALVYLIPSIRVPIKGTHLGKLKSHLFLSLVFGLLAAAFIARLVYFLGLYALGETMEDFSAKLDLTLLTVGLLGINLGTFTYIMICFERYFELRRKLQDMLHTSEKKERTLRDNLPLMTYRTDAFGHVTWLNRAFIDFLDYANPIRFENYWSKQIHPADRKKAVRLRAKSQNTQKPYFMEYRAKRHDGFYCFLMEKTIPLQNSHGEFDGYLVSVVDITITKEMEKELAAREAKLRAIFDVLPVGILIYRPDFTFDAFNKAAIEIMRTTEERLRMHKVKHRTYFTSDGKELDLDAWPVAIAFRTGESVKDVELHFTTEEGETVYVLVSAEPLPPEQNGVVVAIREITKEKSQRAQIEALSQQLIGAMDDERALMARELHDGVGQTLTFTKMEIRARLKNVTQLTMHEKDAIIETLQKAVEEVRHLSHSLSPLHLENVGLRLAVEDLLLNLKHSDGYHVQSNLSALPMVLPSSLQLNVYRIIQEALSNAVKHGDKNLELEAQETAHGFSFSIINGGYSRPQKPQSGGSGIGLLTMQQRAQTFGGSVIFERGEKTFAVKLFVPLPKPEDQP